MFDSRRNLRPKSPPHPLRKGSGPTTPPPNQHPAAAIIFEAISARQHKHLTVAVGVGMALAALLYIYRIAETTHGH